MTDILQTRQTAYGYITVDLTNEVGHNYTHHIQLSDGSYQPVRGPVIRLSTHSIDVYRVEGERALMLRNMRARALKKRLAKNK